jgi:IS4 transposase
LCNFALSTLIYNLWRLTDYLIKVALDEPIRSPPEITAKTFVRALGDFLREVG